MTCPFCDYEAADVHDEVEHMTAVHPDIIANRLRAIGEPLPDHIRHALREKPR